ncbi:hypothetical protein NQZ68_014034 [Dissostichus eleginoides]|nr:hypothetical protein NQZ68_014034 [Dissostichus eleginoides]
MYCHNPNPNPNHKACPWPWLLTMKLEPDPPITSFLQTEPLWCYIEHTLSEYAIQVRESPTDRLTPASRNFISDMVLDSIAMMRREGS